MNATVGRGNFHDDGTLSAGIFPWVPLGPNKASIPPESVELIVPVERRIARSQEAYAALSPINHFSYYN